MKRSISKQDIAIIGMAGRFPGANSVPEYWDNIINKVSSIKHFEVKELVDAGILPELIQDSRYVRAKGFLTNAASFDADFFEFSKHDAEILDPQYRLFLEVVWEALEDAAYVPDNYKGKIGVFAGSSSINTYYSKNLLHENGLLIKNFSALQYNAKDFLTGLIAYKLNLEGPAVTVQTGCSTSLVSVCMACESLILGNSDIVIAGGVAVTVPLKSGYLFQEGMMLSPTGECRAFDKNSNGTVGGNGLGVVILKRLDEALEDKDHIHAVIKGFAVNNDGSNKINFAAPSVQGQEKLLKAALTSANIEPNQISYIETHGTGTALGDLIEATALTEVFKGVDTPIALSTVKPNIGHLDVAAGIASLIKAVQALRNRILPPTINFDGLNPHINFRKIPFFVNTESVHWDVNGNLPRYVGISSFGIGGTNAHMILSEVPVAEIEQQSQAQNIKSVLLLLSAKTPGALSRAKKALIGYFKKNPDVNLVNVAYTLQVGRKHFEHREAFICGDVEDALKKLQLSKVIEFNGNLPKALNYESVSLSELQALWFSGKEINWNLLYRDSKPKRIPLPIYSFDRQEYWIAPPADNGHYFAKVNYLEEGNIEPYIVSAKSLEEKIKALYERFLVQKGIDVTLGFESLGGDSLVALQLGAEINKAFGIKLPFSILERDFSVCDLTQALLRYCESK